MIWSYCTNDDGERKYFDSYEKTLFVIIMNFMSVFIDTNKNLNYYIYCNEELVNVLERDELCKIYVENVGTTFNNKQIPLIKSKKTKKKDIRGKCIEVREDSINIKYKTAYEALLIDVNDKYGIITTQAAVENSNQILEDVLSSLTERERILLQKRYGIPNMDEVKTYAELASLFNVSIDRVRQLHAKALRKLRHPSRYYKLVGKSMDIYCSNSSAEYIEQLRAILINELIGIIKNDECKNTFIDKILERYNIKLCKCSNCNNSFIIDKKRLDECDLSLRTKICLKRAGIMYLEDLLQISDEELMRIRNLGKKCFDEINEYKIKYNLDYKQYSILNNGILYYMSEIENEKFIAKCMLYNLLNMEPQKTSVFIKSITGKTIKKILSMGYLYIEDILNDYDIILENLNINGEKEYIEEIDNIKNWEEKKNKKIELYPSSNTLLNVLKDNKKMSEIIKDNEGIEDENIKNFVKLCLDMKYDWEKLMNLVIKQR